MPARPIDLPSDPFYAGLRAGNVPPPQVLWDFRRKRNLVNSNGGRGTIAFSRGSTGPAIDAGGQVASISIDAARFLHSRQRESFGLTIEEQRTSYVLQNESFDSAAWLKAGVPTIVADDAVAPDGATTADKLTLTNTDYVTQNALHSQVQGTRVEPIAWIKRVSTTGLLQFAYGFNSANGLWRVDLAKLSDDWELITRGHAAVAIANEFSSNANARTDLIVRADSGTITLHLWRPDIQVGTIATLPPATTVAAATRSADVASFDLDPGFDNSAFMVLAEGYMHDMTNDVRHLFNIDTNDGVAFANRISLALFNSGELSMAVINGGAAVANIQSSTAPVPNRKRFRIAALALTDYFELSVDGKLIGIDTAGALPNALSIVRLGVRDNGATYLNGALGLFAVWGGRGLKPYVTQELSRAA